MIKFSTIHRDDNGKIIESNVRWINQDDIKRCPHCIFMPEHYRKDGSCKCDDPNDPLMKEWGYTWDKKANQWS